MAESWLCAEADFGLKAWCFGMPKYAVMNFRPREHQSSAISQTFGDGISSQARR